MKRSLVLTTLLWLLISGGALATHIRAGEVTAVVNSCSQLSYTVFITLYLDTEGIEPGNGYIFFNDGSPVEALAEVGKTPDFEEPVGDRDPRYAEDGQQNHRECQKDEYRQIEVAIVAHIVRPAAGGSA